MHTQTKVVRYADDVALLVRDEYADKLIADPNDAISKILNCSPFNQLSNIGMHIVLNWTLIQLTQKSLNGKKRE